MTLEFHINQIQKSSESAAMAERSGCHDCVNPACKRRLAIDFEAGIVRNKPVVENNCAE